MAQNKINKVELSWIGKEEQPAAIEPRKLFDIPEYMKNLIPIIIKYILYPVLIIILLLNVLMLLRGLYHIIPGFEIIGNNSESNNFFSFWIEIFAAAASAGMIIITAKSIIRNSQENEANRNLQIDTILFQTRINWINLLKEYTTSLINALNDDVHSKFILFYDNIEKKNINFAELISKLTSEANIAKFKLDSLLIGETNNETERFENSVNEYYKKYLDLLLDLQFFFNINKLWLKEEFEERIAEYERIQLKSNSSNNGQNRIWEIIREYHYDINNYKIFLVILMRRYDIQRFKNICVHYIQSETKKANDILNGTEQDK